MGLFNKIAGEHNFGLRACQSENLVIMFPLMKITLSACKIDHTGCRHIGHSIYCHPLYYIARGGVTVKIPHPVHSSEKVVHACLVFTIIGILEVR